MYEKSFYNEYEKDITEKIIEAIGKIIGTVIVLLIFVGIPVYYGIGKTVTAVTTTKGAAEGVLKEKTPYCLTFYVADTYMTFSVDEQTYYKYEVGNKAHIDFVKTEEQYKFKSFKPDVKTLWHIDGIDASNDRSNDIYLNAIKEKEEEEKRKKQEEEDAAYWSWYVADQAMNN